MSGAEPTDASHRVTAGWGDGESTGNSSG